MDPAVTTSLVAEVLKLGLPGVWAIISAYVIRVLWLQNKDIQEKRITEGVANAKAMEAMTNALERLSDLIKTTKPGA